ncbi:HU family DNA-binding protein [Ekhidna sp. To15]|uniref:HU family DNA-binding protein n=1 Tax=Ekhidna sp. To15 TaxID=3395267 RepID=UPI003F51B924
MEVSDFKSLARRIQKHTGQSYADVTGVLAALEDVLPEELLAGKIVRLGSLGSFYTTFKSKPSDAPEDVSSNNILEARIRYRPDRSLLSEVNNGARFEKVSVPTS